MFREISYFLEGVTQTQMNNGHKVFRGLWFSFAFVVQFLILVYKLTELYVYKGNYSSLYCNVPRE
jgi:hypothetical protein